MQSVCAFFAAAHRCSRRKEASTTGCRSEGTATTCCEATSSCKRLAIFLCMNSNQAKGVTGNTEKNPKRPLFILTESSLLSGSFLIRFSPLSAPTKIEELNSQDPGFRSPAGAALCFFVWSGCQFYLCQSWKRREFDFSLLFSMWLWLIFFFVGACTYVMSCKRGRVSEWTFWCVETSTERHSERLEGDFEWW